MARLVAAARLFLCKLSATRRADWSAAADLPLSGLDVFRQIRELEEKSLSQHIILREIRGEASL